MSVLGYTHLLSRTAGSGSIIPIISTSAVPVLSNTTTITSSAIDTTGANGVIVTAHDYWFSGSGTASVTDNKGNPYSLVRLANISNQPRVSIYYCPLATCGTGHTFTYSTSGVTASIPSISIYTVFCAGGILVDQSNGNINAGASTTVNTGSITPTLNNCLLVTVASGLFATTQPTITGGGWNNTDQYFWTPFASSTKTQCAAYARIQSVSSVTNPTHTLGSGNVNGVAVIASFKPA